MAAGSAASEEAAGAAALAGAPAAAPVAVGGRLFMEGHTTPTSMMLTKYWSGSRVALRLAPLEAASMTGGSGLPLAKCCSTDWLSKPAEHAQGFGSQCLLLHALFGLAVVAKQWAWPHMEAAVSGCSVLDRTTVTKEAM